MKQTFILEVDSDTNPAIFTARLRGELNLFLGHGAFELMNADRRDECGYEDPESPWYSHEYVTQHLGDDPKVVRQNLNKVDP